MAQGGGVLGQKIQIVAPVGQGQMWQGGGGAAQMIEARLGPRQQGCQSCLGDAAVADGAMSTRLDILLIMRQERPTSAFSLTLAVPGGAHNQTAEAG